MARPRTRKRYGTNEGGGAPLGQILALALGGGEANPALGATAEAAAAQPVNPATGRGASPEGMVDFRYKGDPSAAIKKYGTTQPFRPNNVFQKYYGMDDADKLNKQYTVGQLEAEKALQRQLGVIKPKAVLETEAKIASEKELRQADIAKLRPTVARMLAEGLQPSYGIAPSDEGLDQIIGDILNRQGGGAAEHGLYQASGIGETSLNKALEAQAARPNLSREVTEAQAANTAKSTSARLLDEARRAVLEGYPEDVKAGLRGEALGPARATVGGLVYPNIFDKSSYMAAIPETRGGIDPTTGQYLEPSAPRPVVVDRGQAIVPRGTSKAAAPPPPGGTARKAPPKAARTPSISRFEPPDSEALGTLRPDIQMFTPPTRENIYADPDVVKAIGPQYAMFGEPKQVHAQNALTEVNAQIGEIQPRIGALQPSLSPRAYSAAIDMAGQLQELQRRKRVLENALASDRYL